MMNERPHIIVIDDPCEQLGDAELAEQSRPVYDWFRRTVAFENRVFTEEAIRAALSRVPTEDEVSRVRSVEERLRLRLAEMSYAVNQCYISTRVHDYDLAGLLIQSGEVNPWHTSAEEACDEPHIRGR